jgi:hypothetical protein
MRLDFDLTKKDHGGYENGNSAKGSSIFAINISSKTGIIFRYQPM